MKDLSIKNPNAIPKFRYLELKNFCLQYKDWENELRQLGMLKGNSTIKIAKVRNKEYSRVEAISLLETEILTYMDMIVQAAAKATLDRKERLFLIKGVTTGLPYDKMIASGEAAIISRIEYYRLYRKFFYELDKIR